MELAHVSERGERAGHFLEILLMLSWGVPDSHLVRRPKCGEEGEAAYGRKATWSGSSLRGKEGRRGACSAREEKGFVLVCHLTGEKWGLREQAWCRQTTSLTARATVGPGAREREWGGAVRERRGSLRRGWLLHRHGPPCAKSLGSGSGRLQAGRPGATAPAGAWSAAAQATGRQQTLL